MNMPPADISIIICSKDRRTSLKKLVDQLQTFPSANAIKILVVEETDEPAPLSGVIYIPHHVAHKGIPYARNLGLEHATGEIIVFIDDDCSLHEGWLEHLLAPFDDESVLGVQGGVTVADSTNPIGWAESILGFPGGGIRRILDAQGANQETIEVSTLNCAYRKWVIDKIGGFDESLKWGGEDYLFAKQACRFGRCLFVPKALAEHAVRGNLLRIWRWFWRRGRAEVGVIRTGKYRRVNFFSLAKSALLLKIVAVLMAGFIVPDMFSVLIPAGIVAYLGLQFARSFRTWKAAKLSWHVLIIVPVVKLTMDLAMDSGRIRGLLFD